MRNFIQCSPLLIEKWLKMLMRNILLANVLYIVSQKHLTLVAIISDYKRLQNSAFRR